MCSEKVLTSTLPTVLQCNAIPHMGLGSNTTPTRVTCCISREKNYVAMEFECLAMVFACQWFDQYIYQWQEGHYRDGLLSAREHHPKVAPSAAPQCLQRNVVTLKFNIGQE